MLRIGHIDYANCTPIFNGMHELFSDGDYEYVRGVPASLNRMLAAGGIDICPSSSIAFSMAPEDLLIMPDLSISSFGAVQSVLLFSLKPIEELDGSTVLLSAESATSVNLLKILLKKRFSCNCYYKTTNLNSVEALEDTQALLLIGDSALHAAQCGPAVLVYDLGALWYDWTGTPFVFALWLVSKDAFLRSESELLTLANRFVAAKRYAMANLDKIVDESPEKSWMGRERLLEYWKVLSYDLTERHIEGLKLFFTFAAELGLIKSVPELVFLK